MVGSRLPMDERSSKPSRQIVQLTLANNHVFEHDCLAPVRTIPLSATTVWRAALSALKIV
jgi:hypothetical protein